MKRRIVPGGILALSLAVALMAATASTASAHRDLFPYCAPLPTTPLPPDGQIPGEGCIDMTQRGFDFGDRQVGTTGPAQGFYTLVTRGHFEPADRHFDPRVSVSGDYTQTNNCPPTLSETEGCLITVTFAPTTTGPKKGTLSIGPEGPTETLSGRGVKHRTPWDWPLTLDASAHDTQKLGRSGAAWFKATAQTHIGDCLMPQCPDYDTKLVLRGDVKKTTKHLQANTWEHNNVKARLKHLKQLREEPTSPKIKIKITATDEFGQKATEVHRVTLCSRLIRIDRETHRCVWHPSPK
jgi:hypothetical protein